MATKEVNEKHLEFIENVIDRMGRNSFQCKTWCFSVITALMVYLFSQPDNDVLRLRVLLTSLTVIGAFFLLDTYYFHLEKGYRELYSMVAGLKGKGDIVRNYDMNVPDSAKGCLNYLKAMKSPATGMSYGLLSIIIVCAYFLL